MTGEVRRRVGWVRPDARSQERFGPSWRPGTALRSEQESKCGSTASSARYPLTWRSWRTWVGASRGRPAVIPGRAPTGAPVPGPVMGCEADDAGAARQDDQQRSGRRSTSFQTLSERTGWRSPREGGTPRCQGGRVQATPREDTSETVDPPAQASGRTVPGGDRGSFRHCERIAGLRRRPDGSSRVGIRSDRTSWSRSSDLH
jgi:hypothetical protein